MNKQLPLLLAALLAVGCGNVKETLNNLKDQRAARVVKGDIVSQAQFAMEANDFTDLGDDADAITGDDDASASAQGVSAAPSISGILAAPELASGAQITYYDCAAVNCLPSKVVIDGEQVGKRKIGSLHTKFTLNYFTTVTAAQAGGDGGDTNLTARALAGHLFIRADVESTSTISKPDSDESVTLSTTGHRVWAADPTLWFVVDASLDTTGFPARPNGKPSISTSHFERKIAVPDVTVHTGTSERLVTFSDDTTIATVRNFAFDTDTHHVTGGWTNTGRKGFVGIGTFDMDVGTTPFCRLDDKGTITIERTYGESSTNVTSEHIEMTQDGLVLTVAGTLTMTDGSTKTKSLTRTQTAPTACSERGEGTRSFTVTGTGYGVNAISFEETRTPGNVKIHAVRTMAETGNVQTLDAVRTQGVLEIQASVVDASGTVLFEAHVVLRPGGNGDGEIMRLVNGKVIRTQFEIDGRRILIQKNDGSTEEAAG